MRVELTDGAWAKCRDDVEHVTNGQRRAIVRCYEAGDGALERGFVLADQLIILLVEEWSFDFPIPRNDPESLDAMRAHDYDLLSAYVTAQQARLFVDLSPSTEAASPTSPSSS